MMEGTSLWLLSLKKAAEMLSITQFVQFDACACFDDSPTFLMPIFRKIYFLETEFQACSFALINSFVDGEIIKTSYVDSCVQWSISNNCRSLDGAPCAVVGLIQ